MALKVGVVGLRGIGNRHAQCHKQDPLSDLVAVCDVIKERAGEAAQKYGVKAYYDVDDMIDGEGLDVVDVATGGNENGSWHFEPAIAAIDAGKAVLVEKPLSNDIHEARDLVAAAAERDVYLGCNLNHYFTPPADRARQYMDEGHVGELVYCLHKMGFAGGESTYGGASDASRIKGFPYFHVKAFLTHPFSVMRHFCGDVTHVQAFMDRPSFRRKADDLMVSVNSIHLRFANGAVGYLLSQRGDATFGLGGWWSVEVAGTHGTFCIENCIEKISFWPAPGTAAAPEKLQLGEEPEPEVTESGIKDFDQTFPLRIHAFMEDVTNQVAKDRLRASGRDALAALEYTWAAIESYEQGGELVRPEPLPTLKGDPRDETS
ncbi:MAG: Gfo/Idh/MocA family oxidoreductase [Gemmatimonadetes bacterium]|nr:Gfo/Idh/MocA family oxidoreductase [Gemmatimonadota bacterium]